MVDAYIQKKQKIEFRDLVLEHMRKILEITSIEFRGGFEKEIIIGNQIVKEYIPDSRKQYIQSIESLSDVLLPYFDKKMKEKYKEITKKIDSLIENMKKKEKPTDKEIREYTLTKLELCRKLFQSLNLLLKRNDYLKGSIYTEDDLMDLD